LTRHAAADAKTRHRADLVAWACGGEDIPAEAVPDVAVRLYTRLCRFRLFEDDGREAPDAGPGPMPLPGELGEPRPDLTAEAFLRLSEEQFAREYLFPGGAGRADGGPDEVVAVLRDRLRNHPVLGTDFTALQAGLRIDPVGADLPSYRTLAINQVARPWSTGWRTQSVGAPGQDPQAAGGASEPANRFCLEDGIFRVVFRTAEGRTEEGRFPRDGNLGLVYYRHLIQHPEKGFSALELAREVGQKGAPPEQRHERATAGEGYGSGTSHDPVLDEEGKQKFAQGLDAIARELEEARRKGDRGRIGELKKINAELKGAIHIRKGDDLDELGRQLRAIDQDLEEAKRDGNPPLVIQELETKRQVIVAMVTKIAHGRKDKNLDKSAKQARDSIRKAMEDARTKLILHGLPRLATYLKEAARYKDGSWTYRPSKSSRDWLT
jgi:hypothetical protein